PSWYIDPPTRGPRYHEGQKHHVNGPVAPSRPSADPPGGRRTEPAPEGGRSAPRVPVGARDTPATRRGTRFATRRPARDTRTRQRHAGTGLADDGGAHARLAAGF